MEIRQKEARSDSHLWSSWYHSRWKWERHSMKQIRTRLLLHKKRVTQSKCSEQPSHALSIAMFSLSHIHAHFHLTPALVSTRLFMRRAMPLAQPGRKGSFLCSPWEDLAQQMALVIPKLALGEGQTIGNGGGWQDNKTFLLFGGCETPHQLNCLQKQSVRALGMGTGSIRRY